MALLEEIEQQGNKLFKYRGTIPLIFLVVSLIVFINNIYNSSLIFDQVFNTNYVYLCFFVSIIGLFIRVYTVGHTPEGTSGRNTDNQVANELNTTGIYSTVRHPLYVGNFFMWLGACMLTYDLWFVISFILTYWLYYERIMFAEEQFLRGKFGEAYTNWANQLPAFIFSFKNKVANKYSFSIKKILKKEKNALAAIFIVFFIFENIGLLVSNFPYELTKSFWFYGTIASIVLYIILKYFKNKTNVLDEVGR